MRIDKRYIAAFFGAVFAFLLVSFFISEKKTKPTVLFFSGSGMRAPVTEIIKNFSEQTRIPVNVYYEGSRNLSEYIDTYGDADLILPGGLAAIEDLRRKGLVKESALVALHIPAILVPQSKKGSIRGLDDLAAKGVRIVMANPSQAASGKLIYEALKKHPKSKQIFANIVAYGSSTNDTMRVFTELYKKGQADAVLEWDIMARDPEWKGLAVVPFDKKYAAKEYLKIAILNTRKEKIDARRFYEYFRIEGVKVFQKHGYKTGDSL
jgi:molybdate transport system substrate-binding protein